MISHSEIVSEAGAVDALMTEMRSYASEFAKTYANHAPMAIVALHELGAPSTRMRSFFETYRDAKQLLPLPARHEPLDRKNWIACLGHRDRERDLRDFFAQEVQSAGIENTLAAFLPTLAPGVGASAFHALMRMAYALIRHDSAEVSAALAYWAATYLPMPRASLQGAITENPAAVLAKVAKIDSLHALPIHELLWHNMRAAGAEPAFAPVVDWLMVTEDTPRRLAATSIELFAATMDFCALHAVTGCHWLRVTLPYCLQPEILVRHFWQAVAALMGEMGFPSLPDGTTLDRWRATKPPGWPEIREAAIASNDEHDVSLAFSAFEEWKCYQDPLYPLAAARYLKLIDGY